MTPDQRHAGHVIGILKWHEKVTKLLFDAETYRIVGTHAGDMIGEIALTIEMGADMVDIGKTIHPHPTLGESVGMTAEVFEGVCTDLPPRLRCISASQTSHLYSEPCMLFGYWRYGEKVDFGHSIYYPSDIKN